MAEFLHTRMQN